MTKRLPITTPALLTLASLAALCLFLMAAIAAPARAQGARPAAKSAGFPVKHAQDEFRESLCSQMEVAKTVQGNKAKFVALSQPYAPLDLNMDEARDPVECHKIKEFAYGYMALASGLDGADAQNCLNEYLSTYGRLKGKPDFTAKLPELKRLRDLVAAVPGLNVVSQWGADSYRVNNVQFTEYGFREFKPSATMGFFPSCIGETFQNRAKVPGLKTLPEAKVAEIVALMKKLGVAAVVRQAKWTRVIQAGLGEKEAGILLPAPGESAPPVRTYLSEGKTILSIEQVGDGGWYYLTS